MVTAKELLAAVQSGTARIEVRGAISRVIALRDVRTPGHVLLLAENAVRAGNVQGRTR